MIRIAFLFIIGIALALLAIYDWRIALRITTPVALIIASLIGLVMYQANHEKQQMEALRPAQENQEGMEETATHNAFDEAQGNKEEAEIDLQRMEQERESVIQSFFANNRSLIQLYYSSASMCHSGLMTRGTIEDNAHCQTAIEAKDKLQQITETLAGISKKELKKVDLSTMWKIEYAENQMEYAYQLSKRRR